MSLFARLHYDKNERVIFSKKPKGRGHESNETLRVVKVLGLNFLK